MSVLKEKLRNMKVKKRLTIKKNSCFIKLSVNKVNFEEILNTFVNILVGGCILKKATSDKMSNDSL